MFCALLLLRATGASWVPFIAAPMVLAGLVFSFGMIISGLAGLLGSRNRSIVRTERTRSQISFMGMPIQNVRSAAN